MADTFKGIITADGKKRQLPYGAVLDKPVSDTTFSKEGGFADSKAVGDKFAKVDSETASLKKDLNEYVNNVDGHFLGLSDAFEFGNITITESGWKYYTSTSRIRTKENFTLYLQAGAIIEIADSLICYIGYKLSDGTYGLKSWFSGSYTVENDGEYVLLVRYSTESNIENILDIINGVSILVNPSADIVKLKEHTATLEKRYSKHF